MSRFRLFRIMTCRFCHASVIGGLVKYGVRHHCCLKCGIERFGVEGFLSKLTPFQVGQLPAFELKRLNALEAAQKILEREKAVQR